MNQIRTLKTFHNPLVDEKFHQLNLGNIGHVLYWKIFFEITKDLPGDIVECGVGRGRSLLIISALNNILEKHEGGGRKIFAYDSFEGFPEPSLQDEFFRDIKKGDWSYSPSGKYKYSPEFILQILKFSEISTRNLTITRDFLKKLFQTIQKIL